MEIDTILTVKNENLNRLNPEEAVDFFRELIWAEATSLGVSKSLINVPSAITVADGGIDAQVQNAQISGGQGVVKPGLTRYQIKTGDFNLGQNRYVKEILFRQNSKQLKPRVKSCLDKGGTLVIVLFGWDNPEQEDKQVVTKFRKQLSGVNAKYADARIEVWQQNQIISFLDPFPALALRVNGRQRGRFETHQEWTTHEDMRRKFVTGKKQEELISNLQAELRGIGESVHIRVWGEAGIGKTKLVLEATNTEDLHPWIVYCNASDFRDSDLMTALLRGEFNTILVLDECDPDARAYIWNKFQYHSPRVKLITIYNERDDSSGISYFDVPPLEETQVREIISSYGIPPDQANVWARECSGSPRVAHVVGSNLINHPEDVLRSPGTVNVWDRYIIGLDSPDSQDVQQRRTVLRHIALFKRFGYGGPVVSEAKAVAHLIEQADRNITWRRFQEIIASLRDRRILQGEKTLYITPKLLHIKLWIDWWNVYGEGFSPDEVFTLPPPLINWFFEMFEYAAGSPAAFSTVKALLEEKGPFRQDPELLKGAIGARFFRFLAKADPEGALVCLRKTVGTWSKEELLRFTVGRREVVWVLGEMARWKRLFADSARLLLALGEAENETWSNNASGIFVELFSISRFEGLARTGASPQERFIVLQEAMESNSDERRALALRACDQALKRPLWGPIIERPKIVGQEPDLWVPRTYGDLFDAYRQVWKYLFDRMETLPDDDRREAADVLLRNARTLAQYGNLNEMVIDTVKELSHKSFVDKKRVLEIVVQILQHDGEHLPEETRRRWEALKNELIGTDFASQMERYVGMDLIEDKFDESGQPIDRVQPWIERLAQRAVDNQDDLRSVLDWLVTTEAKNGYRFGYELGTRDEGFSLLSTIIDKQKHAGVNASAFFLGGYMRVLFEQDQQRWEGVMDSFVQEAKLREWVPELTWRSGKVSEVSALRVLKLARSGAIEAEQFQLFVYGGVIDDLSENAFIMWIEFLISQPNKSGVHIAIALFSFYYLGKRSRHTLPEMLTLRLITDPKLFQKGAVDPDQMDSYRWKLVAEAFVTVYPSKSIELANKMLEHFGERGTILGGFHSPTQSILVEITRRHPNAVWERITKLLAPPRGQQAFYITQWLRGGDEVGEEYEGALTLIPVDAVWQWVDEDVENRAWFLASFVPKMLFRKEGEVCWAREVLVRFGEREDVRRNLEANFSSEGWTGPTSVHLQRKRQHLLDFREGETNKNVKRWVDGYISKLEQRIEQAKIDEEREDF
jgi:hypothetical protein